MEKYLLFPCHNESLPGQCQCDIGVLQGGGGIVTPVFLQGEHILVHWFLHFKF